MYQNLPILNFIVSGNIGLEPELEEKCNKETSGVGAEIATLYCSIAGSIGNAGGLARFLSHFTR